MDIPLNLGPEDRERLARAAAAEGLSVEDFVFRAVTHRAMVHAGQPDAWMYAVPETLRIPQADYDRLVAELIDPDEPAISERLLHAAERYRARHGDEPVTEPYDPDEHGALPEDVIEPGDEGF